MDWYIGQKVICNIGEDCENPLTITKIDDTTIYFSDGERNSIKNINDRNLRPAHTTWKERYEAQK